ncbi:hypothetical protein GCM10007854_14790 [Algimonas porphyrae]|uniref:Uncharacterized protein n=1 Tax=Algimonas porphyrae TaxID=1128113 RepID=A0ABQ5UZ05_9PROT|nr:hypothetical protein GCM10007854_14790 [Algimonas porphyrae]
MDALRYSGKVATWAIIYLDYAYLMRGLTIVTVVPVPARFRARLRRLTARRKGNSR